MASPSYTYTYYLPLYHAVVSPAAQRGDPGPGHVPLHRHVGRRGGGRADVDNRPVHPGPDLAIRVLLGHVQRGPGGGG